MVLSLQQQSFLFLHVYTLAYPISKLQNTRIFEWRRTFALQKPWAEQTRHKIYCKQIITHVQITRWSCYICYWILRRNSGRHLLATSATKQQRTQSHTPARRWSPANCSDFSDCSSKMEIGVHTDYHIRWERGQDQHMNERNSFTRELQLGTAYQECMVATLVTLEFKHFTKTLAVHQ